MRCQRKSEETMTTFTYTRVSTNSQDKASQEIGIDNYMAKNAITTATSYNEKCSGKIPWRERLIAEVFIDGRAGDQLIVSEISRIGRSIADVLNFLEVATSYDLKVIAVKNNIVFDGSLNSKIFATVLGLAAEIERDFIRLRTIEGMANARARGSIIGRPRGQAKTLKLDKTGEEIWKLHRAGVSKSAIARLLDVSRATVARWIKRKELK